MGEAAHADANAAAASGQEAESSAFLVRQISGRGMAAFAGRNFSPGEIVIEEPALCCSAVGACDGGNNKRLWEALNEEDRNRRLPPFVPNGHIGALAALRDLGLDGCRKLLLTKCCAAEDNLADGKLAQQEVKVLRAAVRRGLLPQATATFPALEYARLRSVMQLNGFRFNGDLREGDRGYDMGEVMFDQICRINHSCAPNLTFSLSWNETLGTVSNCMVASAEISAGDELTISYLPLRLGLKVTERQQQLKQHWYFDCDCSLCSAELATAKLQEEAEPASTQIPSENGTVGEEWWPDADSCEAHACWDDKDSDEEAPDDPDIVIGTMTFSSDDDSDAGDAPTLLVTDSSYDCLKILAARQQDFALREPETAVELPAQRLQAASDPTYKCERVHFQDLSVAAFRRHILETRNPMIICGLGPHVAPEGLSPAVLESVLPPEMSVPVRGEGDMPAADFFAALRSGRNVYLADVSVARHFGFLFQLFRVPRYFLHCFTHRTRHSLSLANDTPALFVGTGGTLSALHIDQMRSNFWMYLSEGYKHWTVFHPDDASMLSPNWDDPEQIDRFRPLSELEADSTTATRLASARRMEFTLGPGEVLYIPRGTPHEVRNLSRTVAVSANFLDQSNITESCEQSRAKLERRDPSSNRYANLRTVVDALEEIDWPSLDEDLQPADHQCRTGEDMVGTFSIHERIMYDKPVTLAMSS